MANIEILDKTKHLNLCVKNTISVEHVCNANLIPLVVDEFNYAAVNFPVVFVKDPVTGDFRVAGLVGLEKGENLIFSEKGILSTYIPAAVYRYPFSAVINPETGNLSLCIDTDSRLVGGEGERLFNSSGEASELSVRKINELSKLMGQEANTYKFIEFLFKKGLIEPVDLKLNLNGESSVLGGVHRINQEALNRLDEATILDIHKQNYYGLIYAHLLSLGNIQRLIDLKLKNRAE